MILLLVKSSFILLRISGGERTMKERGEGGELRILYLFATGSSKRRKNVYITLR